MLELLLRPYARIIFAGDLVTGALMFAAVATAPRLALMTLVAVIAAQGLTWVGGLGVTAMRDGTLACSAILSTLALGYTLGSSSWVLLLAVVLLSVVLTAALQSALSRAALPPLALPFVLTTWILLLASRVLPVELSVSGLAAGPPVAGAIPVMVDTIAHVSVSATWSMLPAWTTASSWLDVPAALLYRHGLLAGAFVVFAIAWHSRIALLLAAVAAGAALIMHGILRPDTPWSDVDTIAGFNAMLTAMALGGVWFVPHLSSILLAAIGAIFTTVLSYALGDTLRMWTLPVLALPFVLATWTLLLAMRMREQDRLPASAMAAPTPEEALSQYLMRVRRFGASAWLPFRLPFRGSWIVTQGHDGPHTHKGPWRYAFDFEMPHADGRTFEAEGRELSDYLCYGMPVLAAGAGTVEQIIDGVPDNPVNGVNARENWGNVVIISHGGTLHSVYAHLRPGTIPVRAGDRVTTGMEIGRCGNSGRSLVPHLHFQVQRGAILGNDTVAADFGDVVRRDAGVAHIASRLVPRERDLLRPVLRDESVAKALAFPPGTTWRLRDERSDREEIARVEVDLWSRHVLHTDNASLYLEPYDTGVVVMAFEGEHGSLLRFIQLALARVPFDQEAQMSWTDRVPRRLLWTLPWSLLDLVGVVAPGVTDVEIRYTARRTERMLIIEGVAGSLHTHAEVSLAGDAHAFTVTDGSGHIRASLTLHRISSSDSAERAA